MWIEPIERRRLLDAGGLDPSFGDDGTVSIAPHSANFAVDADGRTLVTTFGGERRLQLTRFDRNGRADPTFGGVAGEQPGQVTVPQADPPGDFFVGLPQVVPLEGGAVLVQVGRVIYRFTRAGLVDRSFGTDGRVTAPVTVPGSINVTRDGSILMPGARREGERNVYVLARLRRDGTPDTSFAPGGVRDVDTGVELPPHATGPLRSRGWLVVPAPDGGAYVVGSYYYLVSVPGEFHEDIEPVAGVLVTRLRADGSADPSFGTRGTLEFHADDDPSNLDARLLPDGDLFVTVGDLSGHYAHRVAPGGAVSDRLLLCNESTCGIEATVPHDEVVLGLSRNDRGDPFELRRLTPQPDGLPYASTVLRTIEATDVPVVRFADDGSILALFDRNFDNEPLVLQRLWPHEGPLATVKVRPVEVGSSRSQVIEVTYRDDEAVDASTFDGRDLRVTGPGGFVVYAKFDRVRDDGSDPARRVVRYKLAAPGGTWDDAEAGEYSVYLRSRAVADTSGRPTPARTLGGFVVRAATAGRAVGAAANVFAQRSALNNDDDRYNDADLQAE